MYFDSDCRVSMPGPIFFMNNEYYFDKDCRIKIKVELILSSELGEEEALSESGQQVHTAEMQGETSGTINFETARQSKIIQWTANETKFLMSAMGEFVKENESSPKSLFELEKRIKNVKSNKKNLWKDLADLLAFKFEHPFDPKQVARKWQTLVDGYKKAVDNDKSTGKGPSKFAWYQEMEALIGERHDVNPVVTGTQNGIIIHRPQELELQGHSPDDNKLFESTVTTDSLDQTPTTSSSSSFTVRRGKGKKRKREEENDGDVERMMQYMKEIDEKSLEIEKSMLKEISDFNKSMNNFFEKILEKM